MTKKQRKQLLTAVKIAVSVALLYFIFTKIDFKAVLYTLSKSNPLYIGLSLLFFVLSKGVAAFRLQGYFHHIGATISAPANLKLYLLGMFYNLFLPGGIGGDVYKGYLIQKHYKSATKKVVSVLLIDRLSGMALLLAYACLLAVLSKHLFFTHYTTLLIIALPLSFVGLWMIHTKFFPYLKAVFWTSTAYSAAVQLLQLLCVLCLLQSLGIAEGRIDYLVIFLISSVVSVIPLTLGGIGSRELTFLYGAKVLGITPEVAIGISVAFFLITALTSLFGMVYHIKKLELSPVG